MQHVSHCIPRQVRIALRVNLLQEILNLFRLLKAEDRTQDLQIANNALLRAAKAVSWQAQKA